MSHDLEDIITVVDGRGELKSELHGYPPELRAYLAENFRALLSEPDFAEALSGHLPGDMASQRRLPALLERLRALAKAV